MKQVDMTSKIANTLTLEILDNNFIPCDNINSHFGFLSNQLFAFFILKPRNPPVLIPSKVKSIFGFLIFQQVYKRQMHQIR